MSFDLNSWLKSQAGDYSLAIPLIDVGTKIPGDEREWLVTNGLGSYASAGIWGANTRRYHGLFVAALEPPVARHVMLSRIDEVVNGESLATNFWTSGVVSPDGYLKIEAFTIYPVPTWVYATARGYLIKQVAMVPGKQEAVIGYTWLGEERCDLTLRPLVNFRDFHGETRGAADWMMHQSAESDRVRVRAYESAPELTLAFSRGSYHVDPGWYWGYYWPREHERGLPFAEDNFRIGRIEVGLEPGGSITVRAGLEPAISAGSINEVVKDVAARHNLLVKRAGNPGDEDVKRLVIAADNFVVQRHSTSGQSIIAGYHWFNDWGRDSMISLPGLTLATGNGDVARSILTSFGHYVSQGMLPNNFPDSGMTPHYNTSDATFWWAWALQRYHDATGDAAFVRGQLPLLADVVAWHLKGTRYNLHVDEDGLVEGGEPGVQLTWMDAKCGDLVVTPRQGKAVEINALWYNFLRTLEKLMTAAGQDGSEYGRLAAKAQAGFASFWNSEAGCLFDVIHADGTADASIRPNQLIALSLPFALLSEEQAKSILAVCERELLTGNGLRTISPASPEYQGRYGQGKDVANQYDRDITYHQGTVWPWLFGPWVDARVKTFGQTEENLAFIKARLATIRAHILGECGLGSIAEIFDGDEPQRACGCIAQAWSVAELLRVLTDYPRLQ